MNNREYDVAYVASFLMQHEHVPVTEEVFRERYSICEGCNYRQRIRHRAPKEVDFDNETETVSVEWDWHEHDICGHCGCDLENRLMEWMGSCPLNKWRFSYDDWVKHYLPIVKEEIERNGGSDYYLWEGVLESENNEENTDGE